MGALTSEAKAEDRVAEKIPAEMRGAKPETRLITYKMCTHKDPHNKTSPLVSPCNDKDDLDECGDLMCRWRTKPEKRKHSPQEKHI